jgi:hypothetical protein
LFLLVGQLAHGFGQGVIVKENGKPNGDIFLDRIAGILEKKYRDIEVIKFWKVDPEHTALSNKYSEETLDRIANSADIVIASQGD